jgi:hypothetical protein
MCRLLGIYAWIGTKYTACYDYDKAEDDEMSLKDGDRVTVLNSCADG